MCVVVDVRSERQGGGEGTFGTTILCPVAIAPVADVIFSPTTTDPTAVADRCNTERGTASSLVLSGLVLRPPPHTCSASFQRGTVDEPAVEKSRKTTVANSNIGVDDAIRPFNSPQFHRSLHFMGVLFAARTDLQAQASTCTLVAAEKITAGAENELRAPFPHVCALARGRDRLAIGAWRRPWRWAWGTRAARRARYRARWAWWAWRHAGHSRWAWWAWRRAGHSCSGGRGRDAPWQPHARHGDNLPASGGGGQQRCDRQQRGAGAMCSRGEGGESAQLPGS